MDLEIFKEVNDTYVVRWRVRDVFIQVPTYDDAVKLVLELVFKFEGLN